MSGCAPRDRSRSSSVNKFDQCSRTTTWSSQAHNTFATIDFFLNPLNQGRSDRMTGLLLLRQAQGAECCEDVRVDMHFLIELVHQPASTQDFNLPPRYRGTHPPFAWRCAVALELSFPSQPLLPEIEVHPQFALQSLLRSFTRDARLVERLPRCTLQHQVLA